MRFLSLLIGKAILKCLRLMGRSGSALPGLVIEKINPGFLSSMLGTLPEGVIIISGTNGKTTTTKVTSALLEAHGMRVLTNDTGSNFVRGTVASIIDKASWNGKLPYDIAVFEQDEAHAVHFVSQVKPRGVVVLNIMRDQMDRFGEIDTTAKMLQKLVASATKWVVLNANDERVGELKPSKDIRTVWYGHSESLQHKFLTDDELHHGDDTSYHCFEKMNAELLSFNQRQTSIKIGDQLVDIATPLVGSHNAINLTAALAILYAVIPDADQKKTVEALSKIRPAFGRGEVLTLANGARVTLQLVKNPGGFTHALGMLDLEKYDAMAMAINDDYADGRDVSWLWDVDFNRLEKMGPVICGGTRAYDMAVRLKYDGIVAQNIDIELPKFVEIINSKLSADSNAIIYCTYTAMLKIRLLYKQYSADVHGAMS